MSDVIGVLRAIVREELGRRRLPELGTVTTVHAHADGDDGNHQVDVKLRASGVELKRVPVAVARLGWSALPNKDDLVLVCFLDGDLSAPVVAGCLYDDQAHPPVAAEHEVVYQPPDEESSDTRRFHLELPSGATLTIKDEEVSLTLGDTTVTAAKDGDVSISAKGNIQLKAEGDVEIQATGDLKLSADGKLSLKGMNASLEGQSETKVKGAQVALAGMTQFSAS